MRKVSDVKNISRKLLKKIAAMLLTERQYWQFRDKFDPDWAENYLNDESLRHPHRELLVKVISQYSPKSVLEVGCASGPNLVLLSSLLPRTQFVGIDVSPRAIKVGNRFLQDNSIDNVCLRNGALQNLGQFKDDSFDLVFTDAVLIYVNDSDIQEITKELFRVARCAVVLCERHTDQTISSKEDHWLHNFENLFSRFVPKSKIRLSKLGEDRWSGEWAKHGYIVEVSKQESPI